MSAIEEDVIKENTCSHRFADWDRADADAGIVATFGDHFGRGAIHANRTARLQNGRGRLHRETHDDVLAR